MNPNGGFADLVDGTEIAADGCCDHVLVDDDGKIADGNLRIRSGEVDAAGTRQPDVFAGNVDLIISALPLDGIELVSLKLLREPFFLVVPDQHPLSRRKAIRLENAAASTMAVAISVTAKNA